MTRIFIFLGVLLSLLRVHAEEKNLPSRFERVRKIEGVFTLGERGRIILPGDVFGQSRRFPDDLRILSAEGTQWPFFLHIPKETIKDATLEAEILNRSFISTRESYLQFDLVIPQQAGEKLIHNQVELATFGQDFVRRVEIFDESGNALMAVGHLIDFARQRGARNRVVRYPASDASRLHIRIYSNAQNTDESVMLSAATLHYRNPTRVEREIVSASEITVPEREKKATAQIRLFDLGEPNRPLAAIVFKVRTPSFTRSVSAYGRNNIHEPWVWVGGGEIHALKNDDQMKIALSQARHRFIKLHIFHYDDQPLAIQSIQFEAIPRYLIFEAASTGGAGLYYRAWDLKPPRYDLKGRIADKAIAKLPLVNTLDAAPNAVAKAQPLRKYSKVFGGFAVAGVSLLVLGIITSMLKQQKAER